MHTPTWHPPKIPGFGIRIPAKENTWGNFLRIVAEQPVFPTVFPEVRITPTALLKKRANGRVRSAHARDRGHKRKNKIRVYPVQLRDREVDALIRAAQAQVKQGDEPISPRKWRSLIGALIEHILKSELRKKKA